MRAGQFGHRRHSRGSGRHCCGTPIAYADTRRRRRFAPMIAGLARLPILIPGVIIGIALLILVNLIGLGPSLAAIILGHIAFACRLR